MPDSHETLGTPSVTRTPTLGDQTILEETPLNLDARISDTSARVRLGKHTRMPVTTPSEGAPRQNPISGGGRLNQCLSKSKNKGESPDDPLRRGRPIVPTKKTELSPTQDGARKGMQSPDTSSSWSPRRKDWTD